MGKIWAQTLNPYRSMTRSLEENGRVPEEGRGGWCWDSREKKRRKRGAAQLKETARNTITCLLQTLHLKKMSATDDAKTIRALGARTLDNCAKRPQ